MSNFIRFDRKDINTIIGSIDEIAPADRTEQEQIVYNKACQILELMSASEEKERPSLYRDESSGRLTIQSGAMTSEPVSYNGIAKLSNFFAVTDFYEGVFPTNVLLRFLHVNPLDRQDWMSRKVAIVGSGIAGSSAGKVRRPRWKQSPAELADIAAASAVKA